MPRLEIFFDRSLDIWSLPIFTALTLSRQRTSDRPEPRWQTYDGEIGTVLNATLSQIVYEIVYNYLPKRSPDLRSTKTIRLSCRSNT